MGQQYSNNSDDEDSVDTLESGDETKTNPICIDSMYPTASFLRTPIQPHETNHTFNGIMFDIESMTDYPSIEILGFQVGGLLGPTKILVAKSSWKQCFTQNFYHEVKPILNISEKFEELFSDEVMGNQDARKITSIYLPKPFLLKPRDCIGFYIHCQTHHDQSLHYHTSCNSSELLCQDSLLGIKVGLAKVGILPFGRSLWGEPGWRTARAFCGSILYRPLRMVWSAQTHDSFPKNFQSVVSFLFVEWETEGTLWSSLACEDIYCIVQHMEWNWFEEIKVEELEEREKSFQRIRKQMLKFSY